MTTGGAADLLPLYLSEAKERLERLEGLVVPGWSAEAVRQAKRELHTLKGSSRMMGLETVSELCHKAEEVLESNDNDLVAPVLAFLDRINNAVDALSVSDEATANGSGEMRASSAPSTLGAGSRTEPDRGEIETVRVDLGTLDTLADQAVRMQVMSRQAVGTVELMFELAQAAEAGVADTHPAQVLAALASRLRRTAVGVDRAQRRFHQMAELNLQTLVSLQVQQIGPFLHGLARHARDLATSLGKEVDVVVEPAGCRLDRRIVEALKGAMLHLVRNAVDHGLETAAERQSAGKTRRGRIELRAETKADRIRLEVADDGQGIQAERVLEVAAERCLINLEDGSRDSNEKALQLLFEPGFSTRETTSEVSGRGIGLDAVETAIRGAGGSIWLSSDPGRGTRVTIDLPSVKRGDRVVVVEVSGAVVAIVASVVRGYKGLSAAPHEASGEDTQDLTVRDWIDLAAVLGRAPSEAKTLLTFGRPGLPPGVLVERVLTEEEVLVRPWPTCVGPMPLYEGFALLSSGQPVPILDLRRLADQSEQRRFDADSATREHAPAPIEVLLVDDSKITREMLRRMLQESGFVVTVAGSGNEALHHLQSRTVDCLITDIEMEGIDGLELTKRVRASSDIAHLPVIVVSTRDRAIDRIAGLDAGADAYLTKQRLDTKELTDLVRRLGGGD